MLLEMNILRYVTKICCIFDQSTRSGNMNTKTLLISIFNQLFIIINPTHSLVAVAKKVEVQPTIYILTLESCESCESSIQ